MSKTLGQGQSAATEAKVRGISQLIGINMRIVKALVSDGRIRPARYFHFDLHAGCGFNHEVGVIGSPLAFLAAAEQESISNYAAVFVELDKERACSLAAHQQIACDRNAFVIPGDNSEVCETIPDIIRQFGDKPEYALGSVLIDPNGPTNDTPWAGLQDLFRQCPRLDVIVNFPATGMKRIGRDHDQYISIDALPDMLNKKHWLIRDPQGPWQWCLCIGRNMKVNDYKAAGFVHWSSERGADIRDSAVFSKREIAGRSQLSLGFE